MPLMRIDMMKGRTEGQVRQVLDISYAVAHDTLGIPDGDRYQLVTQHEPYEMVVLDTGLGFQRSSNVLVFSLTSRPRTVEQRQAFYRRLVERLHDQMGIDPGDVVVNFTINDDADWSFGFGRAQFLTGELQVSVGALEGR